MNDLAVHCRPFWDGAWQDGGGAEIVRSSPADTRLTVATAAGVTDDQVLEAVGAAVAAQHSWERSGAALRCGVLKRAAALIRSRSEALGAELAREEGKALREAVGEVDRAAQIFDYFGQVAEQPIGDQYGTALPGERVLVTRRAVGVVAAVTPWNFPIAIPAWKIAPALAYGNTVVWKPASHVPLLSNRLVEILQEAGLPPGVLSLVYGSGAVGQQLALADGVAVVTFTGSTGVGRRLIAACGELARPIQAELGGKNAVIVADDADLDAAAAAILEGGFSGNGQKCTATSRVLADERIADALIARLAARTTALVVGDPALVETTVGPVVSMADRLRLDDVLARSADRPDVVVSAAATVPGPLSDHGAFVAPTVLELERPEGELWEEELFGPVVSISRTASFQEALDLANDSPFGLSGAVFTRSLRRTQQALTDLEVGLLTVNGPTTGGYPHLPFGGLKASSHGPREQGTSARELFTTTTTAYLRDAGPAEN